MVCARPSNGSNVLRQNSADGWKIYSGWKCFLFQLEFDASKKLTLSKQCCFASGK